MATRCFRSCSLEKRPGAAPTMDASGFKTDPSKDTVEPISQVGDASLIKHSKKGKILHRREGGKKTKKKIEKQKREDYNKGRGKRYFSHQSRNSSADHGN